MEAVPCRIARASSEFARWGCFLREPSHARGVEFRTPPGLRYRLAFFG